MLYYESQLLYSYLIVLTPSKGSERTEKQLQQRLQTSILFSIYRVFKSLPVSITAEVTDTPPSFTVCLSISNKSHSVSSLPLSASQFVSITLLN